jgi:hypothetical protein
MITKKFKFANGDLASDKVTGFTGTISGTAFYITGCNQYLLLPECKKPHKKAIGQWFDEERLNLVKPEVIKEEEVTPAKTRGRGRRLGADMPAPGGGRDY